ncbi:hypothetical protein HAX54_013145 [Datura stramonium]|uniref:Tyrosine specific protein phosphatases domain-containing protein n=1 Tax=Datura stramonium TaxID=4076 RepID=A0ABS8TNM8_DATST|nr:hypothetical protein [Datura stramonium]
MCTYVAPGLWCNGNIDMMCGLDARSNPSTGKNMVLKEKGRGRPIIHRFPNRVPLACGDFPVVQFTSQESQASKYAVVHCTHGHNRTGYMIVHFLVRNQSVSVSEAIAKFAQARPPGIYRQKYVEALYDFYCQSKPELFVCPQTPEWKRDSDQDNEVVAPSSVSNSFEIIW